MAELLHIILQHTSYSLSRLSVGDFGIMEKSPVLEFSEPSKADIAEKKENLSPNHSSVKLALKQKLSGRMFGIVMVSTLVIMALAGVIITVTFKIELELLKQHLESLRQQKAESNGMYKILANKFTYQ